MADNHRKKEDQERNNSSEIETLTYHVLATYSSRICRVSQAENHILKYGFDPSYKTWIHHGEPNLPLPSPVIDNTRQPQMSDMTACLNDLSYIPLNNEQNEPNKGDIGETSNDPIQAKRNEFEELYASANEELYPGCDYVTRLDFMTKFTNFKAKDSNTPKKKVPKKVLRCFLIIPRLQRSYKSSHTAKEITWHATGKYTQPGKMQHPVDGRAWKDFDTKYLDFAAELRNTINDFLARSSLSGWSGQSYKACPTCNEDTPSVRVLGKTAYIGHRRFLKKPHKWRRSIEFNGETKNGDPPREFSRDAIMTQLARLPTRVKGKHPMFGGVKIKCNVLVELNWNKRSIFYELEYWSFLTLKHNLDVMHIEKNVLESILNTLLINEKSKDTTKARQDLKRLGIRSGLWLGQNKNRKCSKPQAAYSFTPEDRKKFYVAKPLIELCLFFKQICSQTLMVDDMLKAQSKIRRRHEENDPGVNESSELFALACGPSQTPISVNSYVVNGVRFVVHSRDERRTTQNSGICSPGPNGEMYYDVAWGHGGDSGGDDRPPPYQANYLGELVRELPLHYPSWSQMPPERKAGVVAKIRIYNGKKAALKERYWVPEEGGSYDLERIRRERPSHISEADWDEQLAFWNDPKNLTWAAQNKQNLPKSKVMETSATREYPWLIYILFLTHTVGGVFLNPEDKALYMLTQLESHPEYGGGSGSGGCEDDEPGDEDDSEDEDDSSQATCRLRKLSTVALNCLTETMWGRRCRPGMLPGKTQFDLCPHMKSDRWAQSMRASSSTCKRSTVVRRLLSKKDIGFLKRTRVMT
nr:hypothetical protein [Tanacetum cinerariifolium]